MRDASVDDRRDGPLDGRLVTTIGHEPPSRGPGVTERQWPAAVTLTHAMSYCETAWSFPLISEWVSSLPA